MSVCKHRDSWRAEVWIAGKRVATKSGFERRKDAVDWRDERKRQIRRGDHERISEFTFDNLISKFESHHLSTVRPNTKARYIVDIKMRLQPFFRYYKLSDVTSALLEEFKTEIAKKLKPKSVNNCLHLLRLILNKAVRYGMLRESPYNLDSAKIPKGDYAWWEERRDINAFLMVARPTRYFAVYLLALETGMRYSEIIGLSKRDIDFETGVIHVHRQWHERLNDYGPTKGGEPRWIDFDPSSELAHILKRWCERSPHPEAVFVTQTGHRPGKGNIAHKYFKAIQRRAKVKEISFHGLRHTFASWHMKERDQIWALKAILGHADIKTTMRYVHHSKRERQKPLNLASASPHKSHTVSDAMSVTEGNVSFKEWRDGRDLNSCSPRIALVQKCQ